MEKYKVAIIGCGFAAGGAGSVNEIHMPSLSKMEDVELAAFCDLIEEKAIKASQDYGAKDAKVYTDYKQLLNDDSIDIVHVCTPNRTHAELTGYNTIMDILVTGVRAVLVPFSTSTETEQTFRARLLAERGCVRTVSETGLSAPALAAAIDDAAAMPPPGPPAFDLDGANGTARIVADLMACRRA